MMEMHSSFICSVGRTQTRLEKFNILQVQKCNTAIPDKIRWDNSPKTRKPLPHTTMLENIGFFLTEKIKSHRISTLQVGEGEN